MVETRTFESKTSSLFYLIIGGSALVGGVALALTGGSVVLGTVILLGALGYMGWNWYSSEQTTVVCDPEGLAITVASPRRGSRTERHPWAGVTGTEFYHTTQTRNRDGMVETSYTGHFAVHTEAGVVLDWSDRNGFDELMATVNQLTPHLGYVWVKREEAAGAVIDDRGPYVAVER